MSLSLRQKQSFYHSLAQLIRSGVPFPKALDKLAGTTRGSARRLLDSTRQALASGRTVGEAFAAQRSEITPLEASVLTAVEKSGQLDHGLRELSDYFGALAVTSTSKSIPGQTRALTTTTVPAGWIVLPNASVWHLPASAKSRTSVM